MEFQPAVLTDGAILRSDNSAIAQDKNVREIAAAMQA
jgi:hypothetical protein